MCLHAFLYYTINHPVTVLRSITKCSAKCGSLVWVPRTPSNGRVILRCCQTWRNMVDQRASCTDITMLIDHCVTVFQSITKCSAKCGSLVWVLRTPCNGGRVILRCCQTWQDMVDQRASCTDIVMLIDHCVCFSIYYQVFCQVWQPHTPLPCWRWSISEPTTCWLSPVVWAHTTCWWWPSISVPAIQQACHPVCHQLEGLSEPCYLGC